MAAQGGKRLCPRSLQPPPPQHRGPRQRRPPRGAQMAHAGWPLLGDGKYGSERFNKDFGEKGQALYSYRLEFAFPTDAGILNYLRGRQFRVQQVDFAEKYFDVTDLNFD